MPQGYNGWASMTHMPGSKTKLDSFGGGIEIRAEFNVRQTCIVYLDITAPMSRRHVHVRINRETGAVFTAAGSTLKSAAAETLRQLNNNTIPERREKKA